MKTRILIIVILFLTTCNNGETKFGNIKLDEETKMYFFNYKDVDFQDTLNRGFLIYNTNTIKELQSNLKFKNVDSVPFSGNMYIINLMNNNDIYYVYYDINNKFFYYNGKIAYFDIKNEPWFYNQINKLSKYYVVVKKISNARLFYEK